MMDILLLSFYVACAIIPVGIVVYMIFRLIYRKSPQVILCMECDQCKQVCPIVRKTGGVFPGPKEIMAEVKSGKMRPEIIEAALLCTECGLCRGACPRGLAPFDEIIKLRDAISHAAPGPSPGGRHAPGASGSESPPSSGAADPEKTGNEHGS